jgi:hypothetical protein
MSDCKHVRIINSHFEDGKPAPLWWCADCKVKFVLITSGLQLEAENEQLRKDCDRLRNPTAEMIEAGNKMAAELMDVSLATQLNNLGGSKTDLEGYSELAISYARGECDSVTAIYRAMVAAGGG